MDTRKVASEYRLAHWAQALQERAASGESVKDFCKNRGISKNTYFYWQQKLRKTAAEQITSSQALTPKGWAQVEVAKGSQEPKSGALFIEIGRCRVLIDENTSQELLEKTCRMLMSLC